MPARDFDRTVIRPLHRQARRLRVGRAVRGAASVATVLGVGSAGQLLLDWGLRLPWDMRAAVMAVIVAGGLTVFWRRLLQPLRLPWGIREMACAVERRFPELNALLISAVDFHRGNVGPAASNSPELVQASIATAERAAQHVAFDAVVDRGPGRWAAARIVAILLAFIAAFSFAPQTMGIWLDRNVLLREVNWPKRTLLAVEAPKDGVIHGARGDDLEIRGRVVEGYTVPRQVEIVFETASGKSGRETLTGVGERGLRVVFARCQEDFTFHLTGGDDTTETFSVRLSDRPRIERAVLSVEAPAYTRLGKVDSPEGQRGVSCYPGSRVAIEAECNKPLASGQLYVDGEPAAILTVQGRRLAVSRVPEASETYHFVLVDADGLHNSRPVRFSVQLLEDRSPTVRLQLPNVGNLVTPEAVLPLEAEFEDELGLARAALKYQITGAEADISTIDLDGFAPGMTRHQVRHDWALTDSTATVGSQVSVFAEAADFDDIAGPNVGTSTTITFRLVNPDELLADFNRREQELRRQFARLVDSQERLRRQLLSVLANSSTSSPADWNLALAPLERRQRQIAAQVGVIRQQFVQILAEMAINRLDSAEVQARIGEGIVDPLAELGARDLTDAADRLRRFARRGDAEGAGAIDPQQARILVQMQRVLDHMLKWEGFQETVSMLREIMRLQRELNAETDAEIERQGSDVFDD